MKNPNIPRGSVRPMRKEDGTQLANELPPPKKHKSRGDAMKSKVMASAIPIGIDEIYHIPPTLDNRTVAGDFMPVTRISRYD